MVNKLIMQAIQISTQAPTQVPAPAQAIQDITVIRLKEIMDITGNDVIITDENEDIIGQLAIVGGRLIALAKPGESSYVEQIITEIFPGVTYSSAELDFSHEDNNIGDISIECNQYMPGAINKAFITITYDGLNVHGVHLFPR